MIERHDSGRLEEAIAATADGERLPTIALIAQSVLSFVVLSVFVLAVLAVAITFMATTTWGWLVAPSFAVVSALLIPPAASWSDRR